MAGIGQRALGESGLEVSALALGSWRTYERLSREQGLAVMSAAREAGIAFLDDARYDDETGRAPIPSGYSEVVFGELFRASGWTRAEVVVSNKLWWEFWPEQSAAAELDGSLARMGFDYVDLIYAEQPPDGLSLDELVASVNGLIEAGKARAWGVLNWRAELIAEAGRVALRGGAAPPCAAQLAYSVVTRLPAEDEAMWAALESCGASIVASEVLARGALTGRGHTGRAIEAESTRLQTAFDAAARLGSLAAELHATPVQLALAYVLGNTQVASALFGASTPEQVRENVGALEVLERMSESDVEELRRLAA